MKTLALTFPWLELKRAMAESVAAKERVFPVAPTDVKTQTIGEHVPPCLVLTFADFGLFFASNAVLKTTENLRVFPREAVSPVTRRKIWPFDFSRAIPVSHPAWQYAAAKIKEVGIEDELVDLVCVLREHKDKSIRMMVYPVNAEL